jgi:hypothetical protein
MQENQFWAVYYVFITIVTLLTRFVRFKDVAGETCRLCGYNYAYCSKFCNVSNQNYYCQDCGQQLRTQIYLKPPCNIRASAQSPFGRRISL